MLLDEKLADARPKNMTEYTLIDEYALFEMTNKRKEFGNFVKALECHVVYGTLLGDDKIEAYEVYKKIDSDEIYCVLKFGQKVCGYPGVVHGKKWCV